MTRGVIIFADDTDKIKYSQLAVWSQKRIEKYLDLPVTILSAQSASDNSRWFDDYGCNVKWNNLDRCLAYDLSPYDQTLVLDADYVVSCNQLSCLFDSGQHFLCHNHAMDVTGQNDFQSLNNFGKFQMPMAWATVMYFDRSRQSHAVFEFMKMVRNNWQHYKNIYHFGNKLFRNDFALTIALNTLNGYSTNWPSIPWSLLSVEPRHDLHQRGEEEFGVKFLNQQGKLRCVDLIQCDFHAMGKKSLGDIVVSNI